MFVTEREFCENNSHDRGLLQITENRVGEFVITLRLSSHPYWRVSIHQKVSLSNLHAHLVWVCENATITGSRFLPPHGCSSPTWGCNFSTNFLHLTRQVLQCPVTPFSTFRDHFPQSAPRKYIQWGGTHDKRILNYNPCLFFPSAAILAWRSSPFLVPLHPAWHDPLPESSFFTSRSQATASRLRCKSSHSVDEAGNLLAS